MHRISGCLLFFFLPLLLWMLQVSLHSVETYTLLVNLFQYPINKLFLIGILWAFLHHFCAGIRYLFLDLDMGVGLSQARASSRWVLIVSLILTVLIGVRLW
jgi:succinate dehydrogenase / fumarate reductase cytochrome b subunit